MDKYGFLIDLTVCIGCHSCQYACSKKIIFQKMSGSGEYFISNQMKPKKVDLQAHIQQGVRIV